MSDTEVKVQITADTSGLQDGASQAQTAAGQIADDLEALKSSAESGASGLDKAGEAAGAFGSSLSTAGQVMAGVLGGLEIEGVAEKFKGFFESATIGTFDWAEGLTNLSISTGLSTDQLQTLQYAAGVTGVNMDRLQMTVNMVARAMTQFAEGTPRAVDAAKQLGVDPSTWTDAYQALKQLGAAYTELTANGRALGLANEQAFQVFLGGRAGMQGLAVFKDLPQYEKEAADGGFIFGAAMVENSDEAAKAINRLSQGWIAFKHELGGDAAEALLAIKDGLNDAGVGAEGLESHLSAAAAAANQVAAGLKAVKQAPLMSAHDEGAASNKPELAEQQALFKAEEAAYVTSQKVILAQAGDTAAARITYETNIADWIKDHEQDAANVFIDQSDKEANALVAVAGRQRALQDAFNKNLTSITDQTAAYGRLNAAIFEGTDAMHAAQMANAVQANIDKLGPNATMAEIQAVMNSTIALEEQKLAYADNQKTLEGLTAATKKQNAEIDSFIAKTTGAHTPLEKLATDVSKLDVYLASGDISWEQYNAAIAGVGSEFGKADQQAQKTANTLAGELGGAIKSAFGDLNNFVLSSGKGVSAMQALSQMGQHLLGDLLRIAEELLIVNPLLNALGGATGSSKAPLPTLGGAAGGAAGGALSQMTSSLTAIAGSTASAAATGLQGIEQWLLQTAYLAVIAVASAAKAVPIIGSFLEQGGVIPSAAGGMVLGGGGSFAILHPREMVLPAHLSEGIQRAIGGGSFGGGGGDGGTSVVVNFTANGVLGSDLRQHADTIANIVAQKVRDSRFTGQSVNRGAFRR